MVEIDDIFEVDKSINVEKIMKQIRENISKSGLIECNLPEFDAVNVFKDEPTDKCNYFELKENIRMSNIACYIQTESQIMSHRKIIGPLLVFGKKVVRKLLRWYVIPSWNQQNSFNSSVVRSLNEVERFIDDVSGKKIVNINKLRQKEELIDSLTEQVGYLTNTIDSLTERVASLKTEIDSATSSMIDEQLGKFGTKINDVIGFHEPNIKNCTDNQIFLSEKVRRLERAIKNETMIGTQSFYQNNHNDGKTTNELIDFDYYMFEQLYRGSREEIKQRQEIYSKYFIGKKNVLDIGCGRGEFLELLTEQGVPAKGIDINGDMIRYCLDNGLNVELADVFEYIPNLANGSVDGIFISQVVEHLYPGDMIRLIQICYDKLVSGGIIIVETVNPTCLLVFAESFYMDLTHIRPVHPLTLDFILKSNGFNKIETLYLSPVSNNDKLSHADEDVTSPINRMVDRLNSIIFGYRDYAVIGEKR